ncbi:uncharacterized protein LOC110021025 [Phalaenopsis equestris]|uniref:uncharacterized protein LOC110021025 n=1 Tax=Phalaenopsis equestris TaxID=78828 RepID=UPI0009E3FEEA|nr:uncharacterized protein LOC110021025 [Phalaenopsis equestris]
MIFSSFICPVSSPSRPPLAFRGDLPNPNPSGVRKPMMAAEVSSMVRGVSGYKEDGDGKRDLVTIDLLGGGKGLVGSGEVGVELEVPVAWDLHLHQLKTGPDPVLRELQDLNLPPPLSGGGVVVSEKSSLLDLSLSAISASRCAAPASTYRSVCTLEKVKSALERAERELRWSHRRRSDCGSSASPSSSTTSSSLKRRATDDTDLSEVQDSPPHSPAPATGGMVAVGCPACLLYVLISTLDPRCPRCDSYVPIPALKKKPRIDLNCSSLQFY